MSLSPSDSLRVALDNIGEAAVEIEAAAKHSNPYVRTECRRAIKERLENARTLLARLERDHPDVTTLHRPDSGPGMIVGVAFARVAAYRTEAQVMSDCYEDYDAARKLLERAIAIKPDDALTHSQLALMHAFAVDFDAAEAAAKRAVSLDPDDATYKRVVEEIRLEKERVRAAAEVKQRPILWTIQRWLS